MSNVKLNKKIWEKSILEILAEEYYSINMENGNFQDFKKFALNKEKPRCWWAGAPEPYVGDLVIQTDPDGSKIKLPLCLGNEFGVKPQLVSFYIFDKNEDYAELLKDTIHISFTKPVWIYKKTSIPSDFIIIIHDKEFQIDPSLPEWIIKDIKLQKNKG